MNNKEGIDMGIILNKETATRYTGVSSDRSFDFAIEEVEDSIFELSIFDMDTKPEHMFKNGLQCGHLEEALSIVEQYQKER